jgi:hypothetical protein
MPVSPKLRARTAKLGPALPGKLRIAVTAARHLTRTLPWGPLVAGCAVGLGVSLAAYQFAQPFQQVAGLSLTVRAAFVPVVAAVAFLASGPHRNLTAALPAPAWLTMAAHLVIALPVLALTAWTQLEFAAASLRTDLRFQNMADVHLPWSSFCAELTAWSAVAVAAAALVARTRWNDLGGAMSAPVALAFIALLARTPLHLFPTAFTGLTPPEHSAWLQAQWRWWALALMAALMACWASRDPWLRFRSGPFRSACRAQFGRPSRRRSAARPG